MSEKPKEPKKPYCFILKDERQRKHLQQWYRELHGLNENDEPDDSIPPKRGVRAELKRCSSTNEAMMTKGFLSLSYRLPELDQYHIEGLAVVAVILAIGSKPSQLALPVLLGKAKEESDKPLFSELRFQHLLASSSVDDLLQNLRRAVTQADKKVNSVSLADSILHWEAEHQNPDWYTGNRRWQYKWAKDYYSEVFKYQKAA